MGDILLYSDLRAGINYFNVDSTIKISVEQVREFKEEYNISSKNFKHVENKILLHNLFENILKLLKNNNTNNSFKPALYVTETMLDSPEMKSEVVLKQLKILKKLLPIPIIIPFSEAVFTGLDGPLKEINLKCMEFYSKRKIKLKDLVRYFNEKGYSSLSNTLSSTVNLKGLYY